MNSVAAFEASHARVCELVDRFERHAKDRYLQSNYQEAEVRKDFIDPLLKALGWDVDHEREHNPYEQEVKVERAVQMARAHKRADYAFYLAPNFHDVRFFVEAKKPSVDLSKSVDSHFQTLRYGYSARTPLAVLTDFEQIRVLDCRLRPHPDSSLAQTIKAWYYTDFRDSKVFAEFYWLFSRQAHLDGSYQRRVDELPKPKGGAKQRGLFKGGYQAVDESFLSEIEEYRVILAKAFKKANISLGSAQLTEMVQRTLDRLVFLRFLEDKQIETEIRISDFGKRGGVWSDFQKASHRLDLIYNGIVFKSVDVLDDPDFEVDDSEFGAICEQLAPETSPYNFDAIPIHILGSIYERFLGSVIRATNKRAAIEPKPEVRKAGGVYYTPEYVVRYIVRATVGGIISGKTPAQVSKLRFADIACGSGSFLLGVYDLLLRHYAEYYNDPGNSRQAKKDGCVIDENGGWRLSLAQRRSILLNGIFGVDIDRQAVEVAQLSLFLKLLEDERATSARQYQLEYARDRHMKTLLPDLSSNIVCGNSLVGWETAGLLNLTAEEESDLNPLDFEEAFPDVMQDGGFDAVVGNPPYLSIDDTWGKGSFKSKAIKLAYPEVYRDKTDLLFYFIARASLITRGGIGYIVSRAFLEAFKADRLRSYLVENNAIDCIVDFRNTMIFKGVGITTCIIMTTKRPGHRVNVWKHLLPTAPAPDLEFAINDPDQFEAISVLQKDLGAGPWALTSEVVSSLNKKVDDAGVPLGSLLFVGQGMQTGCNEVFGRRTLDEISSWRAARGSFFKRATNTDIQRYRISDRGEYLIYPNKVSDFSELSGGVRRHLESNSAVLKARAAYKRGNCEWWQYTWPLHAEKYVAARILCPYLAKSNRFALDLDGEYLGLTDTTVLFDNGQDESLVYILALLNSKVLTWRFRSIGKLKSGGVYEYFENGVSRIPIRRIDFSNPSDLAMHDKVCTLVNQLSAAMEQEAFAAGHARDIARRKCAAIERQIDDCVYILYGLDEGEVALVERSLSS